MGKFKEYRQRANLSQMQLAESLDVSQACVSRWENSNAYPELETAKKLSAKLHMSLDVIYDNPSHVGPWEIPIYEKITGKGTRIITSKSKYCLFLSNHEMQALLPWEKGQGPRPDVGADDYIGFYCSQHSMAPLIRPNSVNVIFLSSHIYNGHVHLISINEGDCILARLYKAQQTITVETDIEKGAISTFREDQLRDETLKVFGVVLQTRSNLL